LEEEVRRQCPASQRLFTPSTTPLPSFIFDDMDMLRRLCGLRNDRPHPKPMRNSQLSSRIIYTTAFTSRSPDDKSLGINLHSRVSLTIDLTPIS
jgi:hypothetical protein